MLAVSPPKPKSALFPGFLKYKLTISVNRGLFGGQNKYGGQIKDSFYQSLYDETTTLTLEKGTQLTLTAISIPNESVLSGWVGDASGLKNSTQLTMNSNKFVGANFGPDKSAIFGPALDITDLKWTGDNWFSQGVSQDGIDALESPSIGINQTTSINTNVTGPGILSYWIQTYNNYYQNYYTTAFYIDGIAKESYRPGSLGWSKVTAYIPAGSHSLKWSSTLGGRINTVNGTRLDQVTWIPTNNFEAWYNSNFTAIEQSNSAISGLEADLDSDGSSNIEEYFNGTDPHVKNSFKYTLGTSNLKFFQPHLAVQEFFEKILVASLRCVKSWQSLG